jgi:RND family efflux transporter MFP subunit
MFVLLGLGFFVNGVHAQQKNDGPKVPVTVNAAQLADVPVWIRAVGQVKALQSVEIRPQIDGVLQQILVREGQQVQAGQLLAVLDDRTAKANLAQANAQLALVKAKAEVAKRDLKRFVGLSQSQAISAQQQDQQQALVQQLNAEIASVQAAIVAAEVQLSFTQILSPVTGQVGIRNVDVGNFVRPSDNTGLFSVIQQTPIAVEMAVPQANIQQLQKLSAQFGGQSVPAVVYSQAENTQLASGSLVAIDNKVTATTGTIRIKAEFKNSEKSLWPGQGVVMAVQSHVLSQVVTIPNKALQQGPQGSFVWVVVDNKASPKAVKVLFSNETLVVISDLPTGTVVVTDGQSRLRPGAAVQIISPSAVSNATRAGVNSYYAVSSVGSSEFVL